jgi:hypothetical protein
MVPVPPIGKGPHCEWRNGAGAMSKGPNQSTPSATPAVRADGATGKSNLALRAPGRVLSSLLLTPDEELEGFKRACLGEHSRVELHNLVRARQILQVIGRTLADDDPVQWQRVSAAWEALVPSFPTAARAPLEDAEATLAIEPERKAPGAPAALPDGALPFVKRDGRAPPPAPAAIPQGDAMGRTGSAEETLPSTALSAADLAFLDALPFHPPPAAPSAPGSATHGPAVAPPTPVVAQPSGPAPTPGLRAALPFRAAPAPDADATAALAPLDDARARVGGDAAGAPAPPPPVYGRIEEYAYYRALCDVHPERTSATCAHFGVSDERLRAELEQVWGERLAQQPSLRQHLDRLYAHYRRWLEQQVR